MNRIRCGRRALDRRGRECRHARVAVIVQQSRQRVMRQGDGLVYGPGEAERRYRGCSESISDTPVTRTRFCKDREGRQRGRSFGRTYSELTDKLTLQAIR
jgi:hypothetical protein